MGYFKEGGLPSRVHFFSGAELTQRRINHTKSHSLELGRVHELNLVMNQLFFRGLREMFP